MSQTPKTLTVTQCHQLLNALLVRSGTHKQFCKGIRNYTMALLMLEAGLRVGEVVALYISDLLFNSVPVTSIIISPKIAKNNKERPIPVSTRLSNAIKTMQDSIWTDQPPFVPAFFHAYKKGFRILTTRQVERIIRSAAMSSMGFPVHPHVLRHTFATRLMRLTNARVVQELLGHKHITSTQIYMNPNQDDMKEAVDKVSRDIIDHEVSAGLSSPDASVPNSVDAARAKHNQR